MIRGKEIGTIVNGQWNRIGVLERVICDRKNGEYRFEFENGYRLLITESAFLLHTRIRIRDGCIYFEFDPEPVLSGLYLYSLFETYGFPLEIAGDEMGIPVDEKGYHILDDMCRQRNKNSFKNKDAFVDVK